MGAGIAAIVGGIAGGVGGFFGSRARRKALERFRRSQQQGIREAREITEERVSALLDNPLIRSATDFIQGSFEGDGGPLATQFAKRLRSAQEARGLRRSPAGAVAEASGLAAFRQRFLAGLLPQAQSFGTLGERFRQSILAQELPVNIGFQTGAPIPGISAPNLQLQQPEAFDPTASILSQLTSGALGGFQVGQQFDFNQALRQQQPQTGGGGGSNFQSVVAQNFLGAV